jgi:hypothetical protein
MCTIEMMIKYGFNFVFLLVESSGTLKRGFIIEIEWINAINAEVEFAIGA